MNFLLDKVKESGIVDIIKDYKYEMENNDKFINCIRELKQVIKTRKVEYIYDCINYHNKYTKYYQNQFHIINHNNKTKLYVYDDVDIESNIYCRRLDYVDNRENEKEKHVSKITYYSVIFIFILFCILFKILFM